MSDEQQMKPEQGIYTTGTVGWSRALLVVDHGYFRTLYGVRPDGTVEMPDDLTLAEARSVLEKIGPSIARWATITTPYPPEEPR